MGLSETLDRLRRERPERYLAYLERALAEPHETVQGTAAERLLALREARHLRPLILAFADLTPSLRRRLLDERGLLLQAVGVLVHSPRDEEREAAARFLARVAGTGELGLLVEVMRHESARVRDIVAPAAGRLATDLVALARRAQEADPSASEELDRLRPAALRLLEETLRRHEEYPDTAFVELGVELGPQGHQLLLTHAAGQPWTSLERVITAVLTAARSPQALRLFITLALERTVPARTIAGEVLRRRDDPQFVDDLARWLRALPPPQFSSLAARFTDLPWWERVESAPLETVAAETHVAFLTASRTDSAVVQRRLRALLNHASPSARAAALAALEALRPADLESLARCALADPSDDVKATAAAILARLKAPQLPLLLAPFVRSDHPQLASIALHAIAEAAFERYVRSFDRLDERTRQSAARAIAKIDASLLDRLRSELESLDSDRRLKALRIAEYAHAQERLAPALREVLEDPDVKVRATAIKLLGVTGSAEGMRALIDALNDPDRRIRANAIEAFEEIGDARFTNLLKPFLADPDNRVRANTAKALHRLGLADGRATLEEMLESGNRLMRLSAAWALGEIGDRAFEAPLKRRLEREEDEAVRQRILQALAQLG